MLENIWLTYVKPIKLKAKIYRSLIKVWLIYSHNLEKGAGVHGEVSLVWDMLFEVTLETTYPNGTIQKVTGDGKLGSLCDRPEAWGVGWFCGAQAVLYRTERQMLFLSASEGGHDSWVEEYMEMLPKF